MRRRVYNGSKPDKNTLLLLHGNSFIDEGRYEHVISARDVTISTDGPFNEYYYFAGTSTSKMSVGNIKISSTQQFTLETFIKQTSRNTTASIFSNGVGSLQFRLVSGKLNILKEYVVEWKTDTQVLSLNTWFHVALIFTGTKILVFLDGIKRIDFSVSNFSESSGLAIGYNKSDPNNSEMFHGGMSEIRVSDIARWTSNFTPPTKPY